MKKELLTKCLMETINRKIFSDVYKEIKEREQNYSKQPGLVAHPQTLKGM